MKPHDTEKENISAYVDGELSSPQKEIIQEKLKTSPAFRSEADGMAHVRNHISSLPPLPEDPYFENRLEEKIKAGKKSRISYFKKPVIVFSVLTVAFMVVLKLYPQLINEFLEEQKTNIIEFYSENLRPILSPDEITGEDVFNFAFNQTLALDKEGKQVLALGTADVNNGFLMVKDGTDIKPEVDYKEYIQTMQLNSAQQKELDDLLAGYAPKIASALLVNKNNDLAVNSNLLNLQTALRAELLRFSAHANQAAFSKIVPNLPPLEFDSDLASFVDMAKNTVSEEYVCFVNDTIITKRIVINVDSLIKGIPFAQMIPFGAHKNQVFVFTDDSGDPSKMDSIISRKFRVSVDVPNIKVVLPPFPVFENSMHFDSLQSFIDEAVSCFGEFNMDIEIDTDGGQKQFDFKIFTPDSFPGGIFHGFNFNIDIPEGDSNNMFITIDSMQFSVPIPNLDSLNIPGGFQIPDFQSFDPDSMMSRFFADSLNNFFNSEDVQKEMQKFKQEMDRFREEMEKWREEKGKESSDQKQVIRKKNWVI